MMRLGVLSGGEAYRIDPDLHTHVRLIGAHCLDGNCRHLHHGLLTECKIYRAVLISLATYLLWLAAAMITRFRANSLDVATGTPRPVCGCGVGGIAAARGDYWRLFTKIWESLKKLGKASYVFRI